MFSMMSRLRFDEQNGDFCQPPRNQQKYEGSNKTKPLQGIGRTVGGTGSSHASQHRLNELLSGVCLDKRMTEGLVEAVPGVCARA